MLGFYSDFQSVGTSGWDFGKYGCYRCSQKNGRLSHGSVDKVAYVVSFRKLQSFREWADWLLRGKH